MKQTTPYSTRPETERLKEKRCMEIVLEGLPAPARVYEPFAGIGMVTAVLKSYFPRARLIGSELDFNCAQTARLGGVGHEVYNEDCLHRLGDASFVFDAAVVDFNQCTIRDLTHPKAGGFQKLVLDWVFARSPLWVEITDSAVGKLHLNYPVYGLPDKSREGYSARFEEVIRHRYGDRWRLHRSAGHHAASYFTFRKDRT